MAISSQILCWAHSSAWLVSAVGRAAVGANLVGLEVESELGVVTLNDDLGGLLDGLGANATHFGCLEVVGLRRESCPRRRSSLSRPGTGCRFAENPSRAVRVSANFDKRGRCHVTPLLASHSAKCQDDITTR